MSQPTITYSLTWNQYNSAQKLSGKTYVNPNNGKTVDCTYVDLTYSSSAAFKKFYLTAVKAGKNYGFVNDVLIDINGASPTGVKLHERSSGEASTNYSYRILASQFSDGDGSYRIGLYVQQNDGTWNYEYFFITTESNGSHLDFYTKDGAQFQVPVKTS